VPGRCSHELKIWLETTLTKTRTQERAGGSDPLRIDALGGAGALRRRRPHRDRQQRRRALDPRRWRWGARTTCFAGSDAGGQRAAAISYSLLGTAKLNGLDPEAIPASWYSSGIADHPINRIEELLPWQISLTATDSSVQTE
jgi:transposase